MGGSDKTQKPTMPTPNPAVVKPQMLTFGGENGLLSQQLAAGGLLGSVGNLDNVYKPVSIPIIENPSMLQQYLHSMGLPYQGNDGKDVAPPAKPGTGTGTTPGTGGGTRPPTTPSGIYARINGARRTGSDR